MPIDDEYDVAGMRQKTRAELIQEIQDKADVMYWDKWQGTIQQMKKRQLMALLVAVRGMRR